MSTESRRTRILDLVYRLAHDNAFYEQFKAMNDEERLAVLAAAGIDTTKLTTPYCGTTGTQAQYHDLYNQVAAFTNFDAEFNDQKHGDIIDSLGMFIHHPAPSPNPNPTPEP